MMKSPSACLLALLVLSPFVSVAFSPASEVTPLLRSLALGDFEEFNSLFENAKIDLSGDGPFVVQEQVGIANLDLTISDLVCFDINVGDILISHSLAPEGDDGGPITQTQVQIQVLQLDLSCTMNYAYDYGLLRGDGSLVLQTDNNAATTTLLFDALAVEAQVQQCAADIEISKLDFDGDFVSNIIEVFQRLIRGIIEREVGKVACQELGSIGTTLVASVMEKFHSRIIQPYLQIEIPSPLDLEESLELPATALDWTNQNSPVARFLDQVLPAMDVYLASKVDGTLMFNKLLRESFLDQETGAFTLQPSELESFLEDSDILLQTHDRLLQTTILLRQLSIVGLDSVTQLDTLQVVGHQTLSNSWQWSQLQVILDVSIQMAPSTLPDAILQDFTSEGIEEDISITMTVQDISVLASLLVVLDEPALAKFQLGSFLDSANILDCLWSVVDRLQLTGLDVQYGQVMEPIMTGFVSPGLDRIFADASMAAVDLYQSSTLLDQALPAMFATTILDLLNQFIVEPLLTESTTAICPDAPTQDGLLDYVSFFQKDDGDVYGNLPPMLKTMVDEQLLTTTDSTDLRLSLNDALLVPLTQRQSGIPGRLNVADFLWNLDSETAVAFGLESVQLYGRQLFLDHVDTLVAPVQFLQASTQQPHLLDNQITFANGTADVMILDVSDDNGGLSVHLDGLWALTGDEALATHNELDFSMNLGGSSWIINVLAPMMANSLLQFPILDMFNMDCWLATLEGLSLEEFSMDIPALNLQVACTNCTSVGLSTALPEVLRLLNDSKKILEDRLVTMGMEWVRSDSTQAYLDQLVQDGKLRCPHSPNFVAGGVNNDNPADALFVSTDEAVLAMSYEGIETVAFGATLILQMAAAVLAESYTSSDVPMTDPLSAQRIHDDSVSSVSSSLLVDLFELNQTMADWAGTSLDELAEYLTAREDDGQFRINKLLRSSILNPAGALEIDFSDMSIGGAEAEISLKHIRVMGLDTIDRLNVLEILGSQTMQNQVRFKKLGFEIAVTLLGVKGSTKTTTDVTFALGVTDVALSAALFAALDLELLGSLKLGSILDMKNILPCLLSAARGAEVTQLAVSVGSMEKWSVTGFRDVDLNGASVLSSEKIMNVYGDKLLAAMPAIFDETVRVLINNWLFHMVDNWASVSCTKSSFLESVTSSFIDLRDLLLTTAKSMQLGGKGTSRYGNLFRTVVSFIKESILNVDKETGLSTVNELLVAPWTRSQSNETGNLVFPGELFSGGARLNVGALDTKVAIRASDARVENLDTVGLPLDLFEATRDRYLLNNTAGMGVADRPLHFAIRLFVALTGDDDMEVRNEVDLSLNLSNISVMLKAMMMVAESSFFNFPLRDITDLNCWLATIPAPVLNGQGLRLASVEPTVSLVQLAASVAQMNINLTCVECSSPKMTQLSEMISSPKGQGDITVAINEMLNYIGDLAGGNFVQTKIDRLLNSAPQQCPHSPLYDANYTPASYKAFEAPESEFDMSYLVMVGGLAVAFIVAMILVIHGIRIIVRRRHKKWLGNLPPTTIRSIARTQANERQVENDLNAATRSMFNSPEIPLLVRWGIPIVILANVAFFLSGHLSLGATVNIEADIAGEKLKVEKFFEFSMAKSTVDIWNSGGKELAILIFVFSGIWPYTKQFLTFVLWFASPARVSVSRRGAILLWLDFWGKWSFVDVFVMVISIAAFRVSIASPDKSFLPDGFYSVEMMVVPLWGLYANMIAQLISQISSHFVIHYHRRIVANAQQSKRDAVSIAMPPTRVMNMDDDPKRNSIITDAPESSFHVLYEASIDNRSRQALCKHQFSRPHRGETEKLVVRKGVNALYLCGLFSLVLLVIVGCSLPSFSLEFFGLVGVAVEFGQDFEAATSDQSIFSAIRLLMDEARFLGTASAKVGLFSMSMVFLMTILFVPILQAIALTRQWFFPATPQQRARMEVVIETLSAWQYAEVYLLAVFVSSWQLGPISQFMINAYCDNLQELFAQAVHYGILREEDAQCFAVEASVESGFFYLAAAAVILALLSSFTTKAVSQYFRDRNPSIKSFRESISDAGLTNADSDEEEQEDGAVDVGFSARIQPVPVLFTDTFRWLLRADPTTKGGRGVPESSSREIFGFGSSCLDDDHWDLPEAQAVPCDPNDMDGGMILPASEYTMNQSMDKKVQEYSPKQIAARRELSTRRQLIFDHDESVARQPSVMDSVSSASDDWRSTASSSVASRFGRPVDRRANLKDDATYATPPTTAGHQKSPSQAFRDIAADTGSTVPKTNVSRPGPASVANTIASAASKQDSGNRREILKKESSGAVQPIPNGKAPAKDQKRSLMGDLMNSIKFKAAAGGQRTPAPPVDTITTPPSNRSVPQRRSAPGSASLAYSIAAASNSGSRSSRSLTPRASFVGHSISPRTSSDEPSRSLEEILNENGEEDDESEYYEETVDETITTNQDAYDEYTLPTDDNYEEMSQYTDEVSRRGVD